VPDDLAPYVLLDGLGPDAARDALLRCCGSTRWVDGMLERRPFGSAAGLVTAARAVFAELTRADLLEAFSHHPRIGGDLAALRAKYPASAAWSSEEQAAVGAAHSDVLADLAAKNRVYEQRFGFIFIICASGKSAAEMRHALELRLDNAADFELALAAAEQEKITLLRLEKLVT
jgi:2-oxo-4-hydroxy-4-carboxy-5-ureidoimidazoline decarboxylase